MIIALVFIVEIYFHSFKASKVLRISRVGKIAVRRFIVNGWVNYIFISLPQPNRSLRLPGYFFYSRKGREREAISKKF
jgi:hypothetical protein